MLINYGTGGRVWVGLGDVVSNQLTSPGVVVGFTVEYGGGLADVRPVLEVAGRRIGTMLYTGALVNGRAPIFADNRFRFFPKNTG